MKTYEAIFNEDVNMGVYGISLVHNPAMEGHFLTFSKQEELKLNTIDEDKRLLLGLVLEPNKLIYRNQGGEEFNVVFSEDTIIKLAHNFQQSGYQKNSSIEHSGIIEGVTFVETWTVADSNLDKSVNFGLSYPKGSWLVMMKVDSDKVWNDYVKTGKVRGFSVDALVELREVNNNNNVTMSEQKQTFMEMLENTFIKFGLKPKQNEDVKLGQVKSEDGKLTYIFEGETLEAGTVVYTLGDNGEKINLPAGEYNLETGQVAVLEEGGVFKEYKTAESDAAPEAQDDGIQLSAKDEKFMELMKELLINFSKEQNEKLEKIELSKNEDKLKEVTEAVEELKKEVLELKDLPAAKPKASQPTQQSLEKTSKGRITEFLNNKQ